MTHEPKARQDAFKAVMAAASSDLGRADLPHQSLGRQLTPEEDALADALMEIYATGISGADAVAVALTERGVRCPSSGKSDWTAQSTARELADLNSNLDAAYEESGFGG